MQYRRLDPLELITTDEDYRIKLSSLELTRAEVKMRCYTLLQRRMLEEEADRDLVNEAHGARASERYYPITDTPLPY